MPMFTYRIKSTGEVFQEFRHPSDDPDDIVDNEIERIFVLASPKQKDHTINTKRGQDFYDKIIAPKKKHHPGIK